jgi:hypothetical protein
MIIYLTTILKQEDEHKEESIFGVPVCGLNFSTPVVDQADYTGEIHYMRPNVHRKCCLDLAIEYNKRKQDPLLFLLILVVSEAMLYFVTNRTYQGQWYIIIYFLFKKHYQIGRE